MVVFSCDACGDSLRKKDVQKHYQFNCRRCESLTCVDCKKQFWGDEYAAHTQCITDEDFKYGLVSQHKDDKGLIKQNQWRSQIDVLLSDRSIDKRWTPILLEMQKYENVPRKKKPFMNWCKCTMKRFPFKTVEEIFDKLTELHTKAQQSGQQQRQGNGSSEVTNGKTHENDCEGMDVDVSPHAKSKAGKKMKKAEEEKEHNGQTENGNHHDATTDNKKQRKRKGKDEAAGDHEDDAMELDGETPKKKRRKSGPTGEQESTEPERSAADEVRSGKHGKFQLKKCVVQILLAKGEPLKTKRILKKVLAAYSCSVEEHGAQGKVWSEAELSAKFDKLITNNKLFKNCNGVVQLSERGKDKYCRPGSKAGTDSD